MDRKSRAAILGVLLCAAIMLLAAGCADPVDLPVPDPQPEYPFP